MIDSQFAAFFLGAIAAGGVAYVFLYPFLSGERRAEKRQKALVTPSVDRRERIAAVNQKEQVAQSLKELEAKQKAKDKLTLETRIAQAGLGWTRKTYYVFSAIAAAVLAIVDPRRVEKLPGGAGSRVRRRHRLAALGAELSAGSAASTSSFWSCRTPSTSSCAAFAPACRSAIACASSQAKRAIR